MRIPVDPVARSQRKADLLLASGVLRGQADLALDDLGERADLWGRRWQWLRAQLSDPWVKAAGVAGAAFMAGSGRRRAHLWRLARWGVLAWRLWFSSRRRDA